MKKLMTICVATALIAVFCATAAAAGITVDGVKSAGEWDGAQQITVASGMGTVSVVAYPSGLYVLLEISDTTDARLGENLKGNDQTSMNINPTVGAPWGMPCDIIFQTGADAAAWGGTSSGDSDGWKTDWKIDGVQQTSLPPCLETMTLYGGGTRITEWRIPLGTVAPAMGDVLKVGGAIDVGDGSSYVYPVGLDWGDASTYAAVTVGRLVQLQQNDGGWDWPLDDGDPNDASPLNTIGPIGKGLAQAYLATGDAAMLAALGQAGGLLLTKTNNFSPSDGYLAAQLDAVLGGTTYCDHVTVNFYGPLAAGTYDKNGDGTLYDTAGYVNLVRTSRASQGIANLAAWDVGMGLVGAASCGADTTAWIAGVKGEIDELDGAEYYDVIGLAGGVYALAFVGEDFDPTAGEHAAASSLSDLAAILAGYQIDGGGFAWTRDYVIPNDYNETIQETAYSILALDAADRSTYRSAIKGASSYMSGVQLCTGGWENYVGSSSGENNEVTAEALWGIAVAQQSEAMLTLNVSPATQYVQSGQPVVIDLDCTDLLVEVKACQAILGYDTDYLLSTTVVAGGGDWDDLIYEFQNTGDGEIDAAIGVKGSSTEGTMADGTVAVITFVAQALEGTTQVVFRPDVSDIESTFLSDMYAQIVWPTKMISQTIVIDNTDPTILITSAKQGSQELIGEPVNALQGTVNITVFAEDTLAGLAGRPAVTVTDLLGDPVAVVDDGEAAGEFFYTATIGSGTANGVATIEATVSDKSGNLGTAIAKTFNVNKNRITGTIELESFVGTSREVVFVATGGVSDVTWPITVDGFSNTATSTYILEDVPDDVTDLSAKTAWNLRSKVALTVDPDDGQDVAMLTGDNMLPGGDLNGTNSINILDYTIMRTQWYWIVPDISGPDVVYPAADIDASGLVNVTDYTILKGNWFTVGDDE